MYISLDWINDIVNIESIKLNKLIDKLTLGGFEVEDTLELNVNKKKSNNAGYFSNCKPC